jgi:protein-S-isoprenylcysteine O-methyltransferase Ste14
MHFFSLSNVLVFFGWLGYGLLHSLLASTSVKKKLKPHIESLGITYRLFFVIIAVLASLPLIGFQFSSKSKAVWENYREIRLFGGFMAGIGLALLRKAFSVYDSSLFLGLSRAKEDSEAFKTTGLLQYVRHPLYTSTLLIFWGWFLFSNSYHNLALCLANTLYIFIGIYWEEKKLIEQYGQEYLDYKKKTPMLLPKKFNPS